MDRKAYLKTLKRQMADHPVVALLGPRQCGKTTLARQFVAAQRPGTPVHLLDLEDPTDLARLEAPKLALEPLSGLVIVDEIQRRPDLFPLPWHPDTATRPAPGGFPLGERIQALGLTQVPALRL